MAKFDIEKFCQNIQRYRITFAHIVPPIVLLLAKHPAVDKYDVSSVRMLNCGAAPLTKDLVKAVYERAKIRVKQGYGLSEASPTTHSQVMYQSNGVVHKADKPLAMGSVVQKKRLCRCYASKSSRKIHVT